MNFVLIKPVFLFLALFFTWLVARPIDNFDIWWHLNSGLWMLENAEILDHDVWSFTMENSSWINISWLFQITLASSYLIGDMWGLFIFKAISIFIIFYLVAVSLTKEVKPGNYFSYLISFLLLLPFFYGHLHLRPNLFEIIVFLILVFLSQRLCNLRIVFTGFLALIVLANSHASVIVGSVAFSLYIMFGEWDSSANTKRKLGCCLLILSTPFLTPIGLDILTLLFAHDGSDLVKYYIGEWVPYNVYPLGLWLILLIVSILFLNKKIKLNITELFLLGFFLLYSNKYQRFELELAILLLRPLSDSISCGLARFDANKRSHVLLTLLIVLTHGILYSNQLGNLAPSLYSNAPVNEYKYPTATTKQIQLISGKIGRKVNVLNDYDFGGYIPLFTNSKAKILIDGRMTTIFPESLLIPPYESDPIVLKRLTQRYNTDAILLKLDKSSLLSFNDPDWQLTAYDPASVLFVKRELIQNMEIPSITYNPNLYMSAYNDDTLNVYEAETLKLLSVEPDNPVALNHMAVFLSSKINSFESRQVVLDYLQKSMQLNPFDIFSKATYAYILATTTTDVSSLTKDFFEYLPPAEELTASINLSYDLVYARALIDLGLSNEALDYLYTKSAQRRYDLDKIMDTWKLRVIAHSELGEINKAQNTLAIAYELADEKNATELEILGNLAKKINYTD